MLKTKHAAFSSISAKGQRRSIVGRKTPIPYLRARKPTWKAKETKRKEKEMPGTKD